MGLMRTCKNCGTTKELRGSFHYDRDRKTYSNVCKECEAAEGIRIQELHQKANLKSYIKKTWMKLCTMIDEKEMDMLLYNLKQIYYNNHKPL